MLGQELIGRDEYHAGAVRTQTHDVNCRRRDAVYVGAVAAFRDIRNAQWRRLVPAPRKGMTVAVERARLRA